MIRRSSGSAAVIFVLGLLVSGPPALAATILQDQATGAFQIRAGSPIGQTFTAEDAKISAIAFGMYDFPNSLTNGLTTVHLYEGVGNAGTLLHSASQTVTPGLLGVLFDFDFSPVTLVVGNVYTALIERPNARWGLQHNLFSNSGGPIPGAIDYVGGDYIFEGGVETSSDARFRVTPAVAAVPLPGALPLFATGLGALGLAGWLRRKRAG